MAAYRNPESEGRRFRYLGRLLIDRIDNVGERRDRRSGLGRSGGGEGGGCRHQKRRRRRRRESVDESRNWSESGGGIWEN